MAWRSLTTLAYTLKRASTWCALWLEQLAHALWPAISFLALILSLWLINLHAILPPPGPKLLLMIGLAGIVFFSYRGLRRITIPGIDSIDRRMERQAGLAHRPFDALNDRPAATGGARTHALWLENRRRLQGALRNLRFAWPQTRLGVRDPRALRIASILLLITAAIIAGPQWQQRLTGGLFPFQWQRQLTAEDNIIIWLTPPDYTGLEQQVIKGGSPDKRLSIPAGSTLKIRLKGGLGAPYLEMGGNALAFDRQEGGNYAIETQIPGDDNQAAQLKSKKRGELAVTQLFLPRANIPYTLTPDKPPEIAFDKGEDILKNASLRFHLQVRDDYGLSKLAIDVTHAPSQDGQSGMPEIGGEVHRTRLLNIAGSEDHQTIQPVFDLSAHPWAGKYVKIRFTVYDATGQKARTKPVRIKLPERTFSHPVAQRLITYRDKLINGVDKAGRNDIGRGLYELARRPGQYQGDITAFLAMRSAASRLRYSPGLETRKALVDLLWATALRIEDGDYPFAERNLRQAARELEKTLNDRDASDEEIARAIKRYQQALGQYMKALQEKLQKQANSGEMQVVPSKMLQDAMQPGDMRSMLEKMRTQALNGDRQQAREELARMQRMLDQMNSAMQQPIPQDIKKTAEAMKDMQSLINDQKSLHERTRQADRRQGQNSGKQNEEPSSQQQMAAEQAGLEKKLDSMLDKLPGMAGDARESLQKAGKQMQGAKEALQAGKTGKAGEHQARALEQMRQSGKKMAQAMRQRLSQMSGIALGSRGGKGGRDPLGRALQQGQNPGSGDNIQVPIKGQQRPVHELIDLLRERSGELRRPREERDYYRRLLEQWE